MAYNFTRSDGQQITVNNDAIDNTYSLGLIGRNTTDYGLTLAKNTVRHLENFAESTPPSGTPLVGQLWYKSDEGTLRVYDGNTWKRSTAIPVAATAPTANLVAGTAYFNTVDDQLYVYAENEFTSAVVPGGTVTSSYSAEAGIGNSYGAKVKTLYLTPSSGDTKAVLALVYVSDGTDNPGASSNETIMGIISDHDKFTVDSGDSNYAELSGANSIGAIIGKGLTLRRDYSDSSVASANTASTANVALAIDITSNIVTSGANVSGADVFHPAKNLIPSTDSNFKVGNAQMRYSQVHSDFNYVGAGGAAGGGILFAGTAVTIGNATQGASHIYTEDLTVTGDFNFGAGVQNIGSSSDRVENIYATSLDITNGVINDAPTSGTDITNKSYVDSTVTTALQDYVPDTGASVIAGNKTFSGQTTFTSSTTFNDSIAGTSGTFSGTVQAGTFSDGTATITGGVFSGTANEAQYADLAEIYSADQEYAPGTVVKLGGDAEVTQTLNHADNDVFGVVSTSPAYLMNKDADGVPVALAGRVPVKVIGRVAKGERLVSSDVPGVAWALGEDEYDARAIIGRALADKEDGNEGVIEAVIGVK